MTIPTQLTQGATTHIKDGLPVTTVSNLGMLTPAAEALIMAIKSGLETVASTLNVTLPTVAETAAQLNETTAIAHANTTANQQNAADIAALSTSTTQAVEDLQSSISSLESSISAKIAENVVTAATVEMTSTGQVKLNVDKKNLNTGATSSSFTTIPVASAGSNGIMPKESYQAINDLQSRVSSLESGGVWRATFATYQALVDRYPDLDVSDTTWTANDYVEVESDSNYDDDPTRYVVVVNGQVKTLVFQKRMQAAVQIATTAHIINVLKLMYPVGSVYIGTQSTCPMSQLFGTWSLVSSGKALWTGDGSNGNTTIDAGLPNITGGFGASQYGTPDGAFAANTSYTESVKGGGVTNNGLRFDASRSNDIYGKSSTVQPPAYVVNVWRRTA